MQYIKSGSSRDVILTEDNAYKFPKYFGSKDENTKRYTRKDSIAYYVPNIRSGWKANINERRRWNMYRAQLLVETKVSLFGLLNIQQKTDYQMPRGMSLEHLLVKKLGREKIEVFAGHGIADNNFGMVNGQMKLVDYAETKLHQYDHGLIELMDEMFAVINAPLEQRDFSKLIGQLEILDNPEDTTTILDKKCIYALNAILFEHFPAKLKDKTYQELHNSLDVIYDSNQHESTSELSTEIQKNYEKLRVHALNLLYQLK